MGAAKQGTPHKNKDADTDPKPAENQLATKENLRKQQKLKDPGPKYSGGHNHKIDI